MIVKVKVLPNSSEEKIEQRRDGSFLIKVKEKPIRRKANKAVIEKVANHFKVGQADVRIVRGGASRHKFLEIKDK